MSYTVTLTKPETYIARFVGSIRFDASKNRQDNAGAVKSLECDIDGAAAEIAFSKWRGIYFPPSVNTFTSAPDVGWFEVRHTAHSHGRLLLRPRQGDRPGDENKGGSPFVLVTGAASHFTVRGWMWGREAMQPEHWGFAPNGRPPCWGVLQESLRDPMSLLEWDPADELAFIAQTKQAFPGSREVSP